MVQVGVVGFVDVVGVLWFFQVDFEGFFVGVLFDVIGVYQFVVYEDWLFGFEFGDEVVVVYWYWWVVENVVELGVQWSNMCGTQTHVSTFANI